MIGQKSQRTHKLSPGDTPMSTPQAPLLFPSTEVGRPLLLKESSSSFLQCSSLHTLYPSGLVSALHGALRPTRTMPEALLVRDLHPETPPVMASPECVPPRSPLQSIRSRPNQHAPCPGHHVSPCTSLPRTATDLLSCFHTTPRGLPMHQK